MASKERNELAELAERLDPRNYHRNDFLIAVESAQRIIAELSKVGFLKTVDGELVAHPGDACRAVEKCREIAAEEGANDEN